MTTSRNLLVITHNIAAKSPGGGVEVYQEHLRDLVDFNIYFLFPLTTEHGNFLVLQTPDKRFHKINVGGKIDRYCFSEDNRTKVLHKIMDKYKFDIVHFQHLLWLPLDFPLEVQKRKIPTLYTAHDHYLICNRFNLIGTEKRFCNIFNEARSQCDFCLLSLENKPVGTQHSRHQFMKRVVESFKAIIVNTEYSREVLNITFPKVVQSKIRTIEMLTPLTETPIKARPAKLQTLKVAIPGNFNHLKGGDTLFSLIRGTQHLPIHYTILGRIQEPRYIKAFETAKLPNLEIRNGYSRNEIGELLSQFDVSLHLSICPETYMITLNEAWRANTIPISTDLGAPRYRIKDGENGFLVSPYSIGRIADLLNAILTDDQKRSHMLSNIEKTSSVSPKQHLDQLTSLYNELLG